MHSLCLEKIATRRTHNLRHDNLTIRLCPHDNYTRHYFGSYSDLDNMPAVEAARENDMGIFIISPTDKGGRLYDPAPKVAEACAPLHPMLWHDLYLLTRVPGVHVLSLGAAEPGNFEEHLKALSYLGTEEGDRLVDQITAKLDRCKLEAMGEEYLQQWSHGLPHWDECTEAQINVKIILWLRCFLIQTLLLLSLGLQRHGFSFTHLVTATAMLRSTQCNLSYAASLTRNCGCLARIRILVKSFGMVAYAKERYGGMSLSGMQGSWYPGGRADRARELTAEIVEVSPC